MANITQKSKKLAYLLRHSPFPDISGWIKIEVLVNERGFTLQDLETIVATNDKNRFEFSADKTSIRARQGHSNHVKIEFVEVLPPDVLYHGTSTNSLHAITTEGIKPMTRQYVHLSPTVELATKVGGRHGEPIVLSIDTASMLRDGYKFYQATNGVWLTDYISPMYITVIA